MKSIRRALLSVSNKTGIVQLGRELAQMGIAILSTGGTAKALREEGLDVQDVADFTGFPEMLDGRVKTLHPKVHGGILARREDPTHQVAVDQHNIGYIDLVVVNLYPFRETIAKPDVDFADAIENIDIGGPAMIRSAAKNHNDVVVVVDPEDYAEIIAEIKEHNGEVSAETRLKLAAKAYAHTAQYDLAISGYLAKVRGELVPSLGVATNNQMPKQLVLALEMRQSLRYGENPHQQAALYVDDLRREDGLANAQQLQGKELSYNNLLDLDAAWSLISEFNDPACAIIKHTNPCGAALGRTALEAYERALATDPISAFGGIIAFNLTIDQSAAEKMKELFVEAIVAPAFTPEALAILVVKKNLRLITLNKQNSNTKNKHTEIKRISGGYLVQTKDEQGIKASDQRVVTKRQPTESEWRALDFGWKICKHVKSNAIVYTAEDQLVGVGAGQMSRVDSVKLGANKARLPLTGTVLASDAFFPFRDGIDEACKNGITAVIQPGGSVRDEEVIAAADEHNLAMVFTGIRHFKH